VVISPWHGLPLRRLGDKPKDAKAQLTSGAKRSAFNNRRARGVGVAAGMVKEQSVGDVGAVLVED
jgi:hypothetical protein